MSNSNIFILYADDEKIIFEAPSSRDPEEKYQVSWDFDNGWLCDCPGCLKGGHLCKHILACVDYMRFLNMALLDDPRHVFTLEEEVEA